MRIPTAADIKDSGVLGEYFFSLDTMRFFQQTLRNFKTEWYNKQASVVRLYAPMKDRHGELVGTTERFVRIEGDFFDGSNLVEVKARNLPAQE